MDLFKTFLMIPLLKTEHRGAALLDYKLRAYEM